MPHINILDKAVAELIAAGEVVERPASIVKELLENSIDAGATDISVEILGGGIRMLRVSDNGCGISKNDVPKAFLRHATSKISTASDLDGILTLGFRGEALASIAAMCRVELATKSEDDAEGTVYVIEGGEFKSSAPAGRPNGTTITVRDVFFNTPARMKFLKRDISEGNSVASVIDKCALSHPEIAFKFTRDGSVKLKTSGSGDLLAVIYEIYGRDFASEMLKVDYIYENFAHVSGYVSRPSGAKPSRSYQNFFINNRFVKTKTGMAALEEAYKNKIMSGRFPACVLNLELDAAGVDVNVHPAKIEVRFINEKPVFSAVYYAVKSALSQLETPLGANSPRTLGQSGSEASSKAEALGQQRLTADEFRKLYVEEDARPQTKSRLPDMNATWEKPAPTTLSMSSKRIDTAHEPPPLRFDSRLLDISVDDDAFPPENRSKEYSGDRNFSFQAAYNKKISGDNYKIIKESAINPEENATIINIAASSDAPEYRVIGELFGTYILLEEQDGLVLVDKHAAHERILYEKLKAELSYGNRQILLSPQIVPLTREEHAALLENPGEAEKLGFLVEDFGENTVVVREVPIELGESDISYILRELADRLKDSRAYLTATALDRLYYSIACRSAVKAGDKNSAPELLEIVKQLYENPSVTHCPHGRPVLIRISRRELEKMFGRLG